MLKILVTTLYILRKQSYILEKSYLIIYKIKPILQGVNIVC